MHAFMFVPAALTHFYDLCFFPFLASLCLNDDFPMRIRSAYGKNKNSNKINILNYKYIIITYKVLHWILLFEMLQLKQKICPGLKNK